MRSDLRGFAVIATLCALCGCGDEPPHVPLRVQASELDPPGAGSDVVSGTIAGDVFVAEDVAYRVEREAGRQRVDLLLSETRMERCGLPLARNDRRVFVRWSGITDLEPGEVRGDPDDDGPVTVHYQVPEDDHMRGVAGGAFVLSIESVDFEAIEGVLDIRFDDGRGSAVAGRFEARPCLGEIDRNMLREGPGLFPEPPGDAP